MSNLDIVLNYGSLFLNNGRPGNSVSRDLNLLNLSGGMNEQASPEFNNGMVFFTRPDLNLRTENLLSDKTTLMRSLIAKEESFAHHIRVMLSPIIGNEQSSRYVYHASPFINLLNNRIISLDGFPDKVITPKTTTPNKFGGNMSFASGIKGHDGDFTLSSTFSNIIGDPLHMLFDIWVEYIYHTTTTGYMVPLPQNVVANRIDYTTRIYYFELNRNRTKVTRAFMVGTAFPTTSEVGTRGTFNRDEKLKSESIKEVSQTWQCNHLYYNEFDIIFRSFNNLVTMFDSAMGDPIYTADKNKTIRELTSVKLTPDEVTLFGDYGRPRVDITTGDFEVWVDKKIYQLLLENTVG